jgi:3-oxoacyl-[acyl-carrier protein] reductase
MNQVHTAIVTGSARGIGAEIARHLGKAGHNIVVNYSRSSKEAQSVVADIKAMGAKAIAVQADMRDSAQIEKLFDAAHSEFGTVSTLINNAGTAGFAAIEEVTTAHIDEQFELNVRAVALASGAFTRQFTKAHATGGDARIINISSFVAEQPMTNASIYSATKGAIDTLTKGLAQELGSCGIRVNAIAPGAIETDMYNATGKAFEDYLKSRTPLGTIGQTKDVAAMVAYLCSPEAAWITGQIFTVSGGIRV